MDSKAQTSLEYLLLVAGAVLLALVVGYYVYSSTSHAAEEMNKAVHN